TMAGLEWDSDSKMFVEEDMEIFTYINVTVGLAKNKKNKAIINVYPNPVTSGNLVVSLSNKATAATITVYDNVGKVVMQTINAANTGNTILEVNALPKGLYIINVNQAGTISRAQFIIQ